MTNRPTEAPSSTANTPTNTTNPPHSHVISLATQRPQDGGFQLYTTTRTNFAAPIPSSLSYKEAAVLPLAISTAAHGLYGPTSKAFLGLDYPSVDPKPADKTILVWGGSSSVGALAIQLAVASGVKVITVASKHNHAFVKSLGASEAFDYNDACTVVDDVVKAISASGGDFAGIYDAVSNESSYKFVLPLAEKLQGNINIATTLPAPERLPSGVKAAQVFAITPDVVDPVWEKYVGQALEQGKLKAVPEPLVVGKGLEFVQKGLDTNKAGVSAKKVVIEL